MYTERKLGTEHLRFLSENKKAVVILAEAADPSQKWGNPVMLSYGKYRSIFVDGEDHNADFEGARSMLLRFDKNCKLYPSGLGVILEAGEDDRVEYRDFDFFEYLDIHKISMFDIFPKPMI
jgi:hypothetical protein